MPSIGASRIYAEFRRAHFDVKTVSPVEPSTKAEMQYSVALRKLVSQLIRATDITALIESISKETKDGTMDAQPEDEAAKLIAKIRAQFDPINAAASRLAQAHAKAVAADSRDAFMGIMRKEMGIDITQLLKEEGITLAMQERIKENVALIKTIPEKYLEKVEKAVYKATSERNAKPLKKAISDIGQSTNYRARLIARDQTSKFNTQLASIRQQNLGVTHYVWVTSHDERVRPTHRANDGKTFAWADPPPETGHPGHDINCRCTARPVIDLGKLEEQITEEPAAPTRLAMAVEPEQAEVQPPEEMSVSPTPEADIPEVVSAGVAPEELVSALTKEQKAAAKKVEKETAAATKKAEKEAVAAAKKSKKEIEIEKDDIDRGLSYGGRVKKIYNAAANGSDVSEASLSSIKLTLEVMEKSLAKGKIGELEVEQLRLSATEMELKLFKSGVASLRTRGQLSNYMSNWANGVISTLENKRKYSLSKIGSRSSILSEPEKAIIKNENTKGVPVANSPYIDEKSLMLAASKQDARASGKLSSLADLHGISKDEVAGIIQQSIRERTSNSDVFIRIKEGSFRNMLDDGRYKTQFEIRKSGGLLDNNTRAMTEGKVLGTKENIPPEKRPVYGYLGYKGNTELFNPYSSVEQYGTIAMKIKRDVRPRTTITIGDSLDTTGGGRTIRVIGSPIDNPSHRSVTLESYHGKETPRILDIFKSGKFAERTSYIEAQIHGGVSVNDIEEVIFSSEPSKGLIAKMNGAGLKWRVEVKQK